MELKKQYLNFNEYKVLGGTLDETPFSILEMQAQLIVDKYTFGRLKNLPEQIKEVKLCIFELMHKLDNYKSEAGNVASENIDGYSISYATINTELIETHNKEIKNIIRTYLSGFYTDDGVPYLYVGV